MQTIPLLLTRPEGANASFAERFPPDLRAGLRLVDCPLMRIVPLGTDAQIEPDAVAVFTSSNGVQFAPPGNGRRAFCVGEATTAAAQAAGWRAECAGQTARDLIRYMKEVPPNGSISHLSGAHVRGGVVEALRDIGLTARRLVLYDQELLPLSAEARAALSGDLPVIVPLFSPRAAAHFADLVPPSDRLRIVALSAAVADALWKPGKIEATVAGEPTAEAMLAEIEKTHGLCRLD